MRAAWILLSLCVPVWAFAQAEVPDASSLRLAVAHFDGAGPAAAVAPEVASAVAEALRA